MPTYSIKRLNNEYFQKMEVEWSKCLSISEGDPLFSSWKWQLTWWKIWQARLNLTLSIYGIFNGDILEGIAPCYTYICHNQLGIKIKRCELIGNYSYNNDSIRSEYLNFILPKKKAKEFLPLIFSTLEKLEVDQLILKDMNAKSQIAILLSNTFPKNIQSTDKGIKIKCIEPFKSYLEKLGKNTRLKLFSRRKLLEPYQVVEVKTDTELTEFFDSLNKMHLVRWGNNCFSSHSLEFHTIIAKHYLNQNQLKALCLYKDNEIQAVCYDIKAGDTLYNIQLGFKQYPSNKISLGTLTLGVAIEQAHQNHKIEYYDLLAGNGKNTFYKDRLQGDIQNFITFDLPLSRKQAVYSSIIKKLKKLKKFKSFFNKIKII